MVSIPRRLASSKARSRLAELPLVDSPTAMSSRPPNAASCRANTTSTPMSLHSAVTTDVSLASPNAGSAGAALPRWGPDAGTASRAAARRWRCRRCRRRTAARPRRTWPRPPARTGDPRPVPLGDDPPQLADLRGLGHRGARAPARARRTGRSCPRTGTGTATPCASPRDLALGHRALHATAIASLACTRIVSPTPARHQRDADRLLARAGVDDGQLSPAAAAATLTSTAMSPQVMQCRIARLQAVGQPVLVAPSSSVIAARPSAPCTPARPAARRTRAPAPRARGSVVTCSSLTTRGSADGDDQQVVGRLPRRDPAAVPAGQRDRQQAALPGRLEPRAARWRVSPSAEIPRAMSAGSAR